MAVTVACPVLLFHKMARSVTANRRALRAGGSWGMMSQALNIAVGDRAAWPAAFPQRLLVIDEFGTFAGMAARAHRRAGGTGAPPALDQRRQVEWQTPPGVPPWDTPGPPPAAPAGQVTHGDGEDLVIGIAAATYLGYDKPGSFRRARTRRPVPGETRTSDGRPAWPPPPSKPGTQPATTRPPATTAIAATP